MNSPFPELNGLAPLDLYQSSPREELKIRPGKLFLRIILAGDKGNR